MYPRSAVVENHPPSDATARLHLVLVPGFVGFDALGQLDYYAGVTQVFDHWNGPRGQASRHVSIHYFDNSPTASVKLRSTRLRGYLAERVARGEFAPGDRLALIGHSTGGLDIRRALYDIAADEDEVLVADGCCRVRHSEILALIKRVVFLSVPHFGTNLADFACRFGTTIQGFAADAVVGLQFNHGWLGTLRRQLFALLPSSQSNLVLAIVDALDESDENPTATDEQQAAQREARFALTAYLDNIARDFSIIEDLQSQTPANTADDPSVPPRPKSPAHFSESERKEEITTWRTHGIETRSYATRVPPRYTRTPTRAIAEKLVRAMHWAGPAMDLVVKVIPRGPVKWLVPPVAAAIEVARAGELLSVPAFLDLLGWVPSLVFDVFHAACADSAGPFRDPESLASQSLVPTYTELGAKAAAPPQPRSRIAVGDSDGVVNTLSQFWPFDPENPAAHPVTLVDADHGDVIGHFALKALAYPVPGGRRFFAYDFFQTELRFTQAQFDKLWKSVFDFCATALEAADASKETRANRAMHSGADTAS
ncbi:MAG TPA: hypothetical protein VHV30_03675 [Polyangiaceae bacterium]|nr:hypothetical protein [Polyangiaceae bacterium]